MRRRLVLTVWVVAVVGVGAPAAGAAFPGDDGLIAFSYESPVPGEVLTQNDLFVIALDGADLVALTDTPFRHEFAPAWSPDGTRIAFWRSKAPFGHGSIWTVASDGSDPVRLTSGIDARDPAWSPNGRRIAFTLFGGRRGGPDIATMHAEDGGAIRRLTRWPSQEFEPAWSPDGSTIAFTRGYQQGDVGDVWTVDIETGRATRLTSSPGYDHQVAWFPDGTMLTFERVTSFTSAKLMRIAADGTTTHTLTWGHFDADPAFAPSGALIVFASDRRRSFFPDLWLMGADGSSPHRLLDLPGASTTPDWQPVGR